MCQEAIRLTYLNPGCLGLLGAPTYPMLRDATQTTLLRILDDNRIVYDFNKAENIVLLKDTGSKILFRAVEEFERLRGTNLAWFGLDELTYASEGAWLRLEGRLRDPKAARLCGFAVWTPKGFDWVYRRFVEGRIEGYETILARPFENRHILRKIPDFYERLKRSYDARFFEQEALGEYVQNHDGQVYTAFDRVKNLAEMRVNPARPLLWALDFNVDPMCSVVAQLDGKLLYALDEIVLRNSTTIEACEEFHARYPNHPMGVAVYGDVSGNHQQTTGSTDYQVIRTFMRREGYDKVQYKIGTINPPVRERVQLMNAKLMNAAGDIELLVDGKCRELIRDFEEVTYKDRTSQIDKERDSKRTHLSDALGYLVWEEFHPRVAVGEQGQRLV